MKQNIKIVRYGAGNIASVVNALSRLGIDAGLAACPADLEKADKLIFPGVGHAKPAMESLKLTGLDRALKEFSRPVLGICLGMQLMASSSEEGNMKGLGLFNVTIKRFSGKEKVPHMGWNSIRGLNGPLFERLSEESHVYFVHSYYMPRTDFTAACCSYGVEFSAAAWRDNFFGVQFHPEKSGYTGEKILENFINL